MKNKKYINTFICCSLLLMLQISFSYAGHIKSPIANYYHSIFANSSPIIRIQCFALKQGCGDELAKTLSNYLANYKSEESLKWAEEALKNCKEASYESIAAAFIVSQSKNPITSIDVELKTINISISNRFRKLLGFKGGLPRCIETMNTINKETPDKNIAIKGLTETISTEELKSFKDKIQKYALIEIDEDTSDTRYLYYPIIGYMNQTGDLEMLDILWKSKLRIFKEVVFDIASFTNDPAIIEKVLDFTKSIHLKDDNMNQLFRLKMLSVFHNQQEFKSVGVRLREIIQKPEYYEEHIQTLLSILGEEGWNYEDCLANKDILEAQIKNMEYKIGICNESMKYCEKTIEAYNEKLTKELEK